MDKGRGASIAREFRVMLDPDAPTGSMSGSQVRRVVRDDGTHAVLKVTFADAGEMRHSAERELAFYRHLRPEVGVRTPSLLDYRLRDDYIAILISAHTQHLPAPEWTDEHFLALARDLAALHGHTPPAGDKWHRESWLTSMLRHRVSDSVRQFWRLPGEPELIEPILINSADLVPAITEPERCLIHGDCHTDNILVTSSGLVWTDWQATGIGDPSTELAFAASRATPSGAKPPLADMITEYALLRQLDRETFAHSVLAAELAISIYAWPEYATYNTPAGVERIRHRTHTLARAWLTG